VYDAMKVKKRFEHMPVGFLSFHLVLRFFALSFSCCFFFLSLLLVFATMLIPISTYKSPEISLLSSSGFRTITVRTKPEFITSNISW